MFHMAKNVGLGRKARGRFRQPAFEQAFWPYEGYQFEFEILMSGISYEQLHNETSKFILFQRRETLRLKLQFLLRISC